MFQVPANGITLLAAASAGISFPDWSSIWAAVKAISSPKVKVMFLGAAVSSNPLRGELDSNSVCANAGAGLTKSASELNSTAARALRISEPVVVRITVLLQT